MTPVTEEYGGSLFVNAPPFGGFFISARIGDEVHRNRLLKRADDFWQHLAAMPTAVRPEVIR